LGLALAATEEAEERGHIVFESGARLLAVFVGVKIKSAFGQGESALRKKCGVPAAVFVVGRHIKIEESVGADAVLIGHFADERVEVVDLCNTFEVGLNLREPARIASDAVEVERIEVAHFLLARTLHGRRGCRLLADALHLRGDSVGHKVEDAV